MRTAYHEAGHAVFCHLHGWQFERVSIIPERQNLGHVEMPAAVSATLLIVSELLAGVVSERLAGLYAGDTAAASDYGQIERILSPLDPAQRQELLEIAEKYSAFVLKSQWPLVEKLAGALAECKEMTGQEATKILADL